jgi:hypothetical protein
MPYAVRIWFGNRPAVERTADGYVLVAQPKAGVPVRVGVPPSTTVVARVREACATDALADIPSVT